MDSSELFNVLGAVFEHPHDKGRPSSDRVQKRNDLKERLRP